MNIFDRENKPLSLEPRKVLHSTDLPVGLVKQRNIEPNRFMIKFGLAADRPTTPGAFDVTFFATDTGVLSLWNGTAWKTTTLL